MIQKMNIVYLAKHETLGEYVGVTRQGLTNRASMHFRESRIKKTAEGSFHHALSISNREEWDWSILHFILDDEDLAHELEAKEIAERNTELNMRSGGKGGGSWMCDRSRFATRTGSKASEETKKKLSDFQKSRPRKREYDRDEMFQLHEKGFNIAQIAKKLSCDYALVWRVINGEYKK